MQKNDYGFDVDEKLKEIHNKHSDEAIKLKEEDDQEVGCGQEDETNVYQAGARGAKQAAQSVVFQEEKVSLPVAQIPNDYSNLQVGAEVKQLFEFIASYNYIKFLKQFWMQYQSHLFQIMHLRQLVYLHQINLLQINPKLDLPMREMQKQQIGAKNTTIYPIKNQQPKGNYSMDY